MNCPTEVDSFRPFPERLFDYNADRVVPAFESLARAASTGEAQNAYNELLDAIGHNHSGTPYAAMAPAVRLLAQLVPLLDAGGPAGMEVVTDCLLWSAGVPVFIGPNGSEHNLGIEILADANALRALAERWKEDPDDRRQRAATGLLEALADPGGDAPSLSST